VKIESNMPKKLTTEEWIKKAKAVHGDKYDYSKAKYVDAKTKICIICPKHGEFWQEANSHLMGKGCPKCSCDKTGKRLRDTIEEFIEKAKKVHGDKYDYSKVKYVNARTNVCIICPIHGEFWQTPDAHIRGARCPSCAGIKQLTTEEFIRRAKKIHGDKYDYSKVNYVNSSTKVCIICLEHGEFWQLPFVHLKGSGCPRCVGKYMTTEEFIRKAREVHGDKYDYSKVKYVDGKTNVCIICPIHGEFWQLPGNHLIGKGCSKCAGKNMSTEEFIRRAKKIHGDKYDYSNVNYIKSREKVCIICPIHGEFWQTPNAHLRGQGCPICNNGFPKRYKFNLLEEFESEYDFRAFLNNSDINILQVILRNIEPKFDPIKQDIEKALVNSTEIDPINSLREKYTSDSEDESDEEFNIATAPNIDLDDDNAIDSMMYTDVSKNDNTPTIDEVIRNTEREIKVINKVEHMLTPEDREYIMNKFLNDKRRAWILERENSVK